MIKTHGNLGLFGPDRRQELSIFASRKLTQAGTHKLSEGLQIVSTAQRTDQRRNAGLFQRGLRKSSSLTNGMVWSVTKIRSESMALRPEVYTCPTTLSMRPSWALR
jgi:hypothetical protein